MLERQASALALLVLFLPLASGSSLAAEPGNSGLDAVDLRLKIVAATMNHRLLVWETCTGGACTSEGYLQWFKTEWNADGASDDAAPVRSVLANCELRELTGEVVVHNAAWSTGTGADPLLEVVVSQPARPLEQEILTVSPERPCDYRLERRKADAG